MKQLFKTETTYSMIKYKGKLKHIETIVRYFYEYEQEAPDFDYGNAEENEKEMRRFDTGELSNLLLIVEATALGEKGSDVLGQVFVVSSRAEEQLLQTAIEHDMKNTACKELRDAILSKYDALTQALTGKAG